MSDEGLFENPGHVYTRYKSIVRKHRYRKTFVKDLADQVQLDLGDMGKYGSKSKGYRWTLTAVEILSRYAFAIPVYRKDGENMTKAVGLLLGKFKERFGKYPDSSSSTKGRILQRRRQESFEES